MTAHPFNFRDADLILRSSSQHAESDGHSGFVEFHVHHCVLSAASLFFETMLSLPQPQDVDEACLPVIPFPESAAVLEVILRYIYPLPSPTIDTLDELVPALEAARKYDLMTMVDALRRRLVSPEFLKASPLRVYALAVRYELDEEASIASRATLAIGLHDQPLHEDLKAMSAYAYHRLFLLHEQRSRAAIELLRLPDEVKCMFCNGRRQSMNDAPKWWADYRERATEELRLRPSSEVICSLPFLQQSAQAAGCERCAGCILASSWFFEQLKKSIDTLPTMI